MKLSEEVKTAIKNEFKEFKDKMYAGIPEDKREDLGMVFTPPKASIEMIEHYDSISNKTILDPCCGSGNLLVACLLAGADADKIFGNELTIDAVKLARKRIHDILARPDIYPTVNRLHIFNDWQIHVGNATDKLSFEFSPEYNRNMISHIKRITQPSLFGDLLFMPGDINKLVYEGIKKDN